MSFSGCALVHVRQVLVIDEGKVGVDSIREPATRAKIQEGLNPVGVGLKHRWVRIAGGVKDEVGVRVDDLRYWWAVR